MVFVLATFLVIIIVIVMFTFFAALIAAIILIITIEATILVMRIGLWVLEVQPFILGI
jgi:hypothetical protein